MDALTQSFLTALKRKQFEGSVDTVMQTLLFLRAYCGRGKWLTAADMIEDVRNIGKELINAAPAVMVVGNIVRRVLHIIREEFQGVLVDLEQAGDSAVTGRVIRPELNNILYSCPINYGATLTSEQVREFKPRVIEAIDQLKTEIQNVYDNIKAQAETHIHHNEVILVYGYSTTVLRFLKEAVRKNLALEVFVAEGCDCRGHNMARELATSSDKIQVTLIPDSSIFALMSRINMVILGAHAVLANGALLAPSGVHMTALAARHHAVPVIVCCGLFKLSPLFPSRPDAINVLLSPSHALPNYQTRGTPATLQVVNPQFDLVPPELITLFVTNSGSYNSTYIYRLLSDVYSGEDYNL
eukprot:c2599_g1_i1.p1 GENE.c2599_g1_i1~~c2599_g1_i1.p1  ORF type:complete len:355 (-),score=75.07 c2599_g1_i1:158-1222(-)